MKILHMMMIILRILLADHHSVLGKDRLMYLEDLKFLLINSAFGTLHLFHKTPLWLLVGVYLHISMGNERFHIEEENFQNIQVIDFCTVYNKVLTVLIYIDPLVLIGSYLLKGVRCEPLEILG